MSVCAVDNSTQYGKLLMSDTITPFSKNENFKFYEKTGSKNRSWFAWGDFKNLEVSW